MQQMVNHRLELHLVVIYKGHWSAIDHPLQWNVESTSELDYERASTPMGPNGPRSELIYHDDMVYKGWISSRSILMHKVIVDLYFLRVSSLNGETYFLMKN